MDLFTAPWPGPGNSEGPVDPDEWIESSGGEPLDDREDESLITVLPWPGPGDSEA